MELLIRYEIFSLEIGGRVQMSKSTHKVQVVPSERTCAYFWEEVG